MATYAIEEQQLTNIADAIRTQTGGTETLSLDEMATEISNISGGVTSWNDLEDKPFGEVLGELTLISTDSLDDYCVVHDDIFLGSYADVPAIDYVELEHNMVCHVKFNGTVTYITDYDAETTETVSVSVDEDMVCDDSNIRIYYTDTKYLEITASVLTNSYNVIGSREFTGFLEVTHVGVTTATLDPKYLPDTVATKEYVDEKAGGTGGNAVGLIITYHDNLDGSYYSANMTYEDALYAIGDGLLFGAAYVYEDSTHEEISRDIYQIVKIEAVGDSDSGNNIYIYLAEGAPRFEGEYICWDSANDMYGVGGA